MQRSLTSAVAGAILVLTASAALAQSPAAPGTPQARGKAGVNAGSLSCKVAGGMGFVFGSSKTLDCLFARTDGVAEAYSGTINKFGVDIGFTKEGHIVWLVFAPGQINAGALSGDYAGVTAAAAAGLGLGANVLLGGSNKQISLQPVSVEGGVGLNVAAGVAEVSLKSAK
jgi:Protein of unknown function (DUF992)